jgi:cation diffusion facilitator family transporter
MLNQEKVKVARLSVISNFTLIILKVIVGLLTHSVSIISEAIHSLNDFVAAVIAFFAVKNADIPADKEHPFGHGKLENVSGTVEGILIILAALWIIWEAIKKIRYGGEVINLGWGMGVMLFSSLVNIFVAVKLFKTARATNSVALLADAEHLRTDVITSFGVFAGLALIKLTGLVILDPSVAILIALIIIRAGYRVTKEAFNPLIDASVQSETETQIREIIQASDKRILGFHQLRARKAGAYYHIDMHLECSKKLSVEEAHHITENIENALEANFAGCSTIIHIEPYEGKEQTEEDQTKDKKTS